MPNTSSSQKVFKSKEFIEEEDDNETSASEIEQYNIMNRPKRNIILNTNSLSIDQIQLNDSDSEDEDFHVENSNSYSSCNSSSSCSNSSGEDDDDDVDENEQINTSQNDLNESNQVGKEHSDSNGVVKTKRKYTKRKTKNAEQDENGEAKKKPKKEKTPSTKSPRTTKTSTKKSKKKLKKILDAKKLELNHENDKILSTFKNVKTSAKQQLNKQVKANRISNGIKEETHHEQTFNLTHSTCSGPFVRQLVHEDSSSKYSTYIVISNNVNDLNGVDLTNDANTKIDTLLPKEKLEQIDDPNNVINWVCSLCHFKPNCYDGLGPLFGPYKIRLTDTDSGLTFFVNFKINLLFFLFGFI